MKKQFLTLLLLALVFSGCIQAKDRNCQLDNDALQSMPSINVVFARSDGTSFSVQAKLADNYTTRAAGFQRVCPSTIAASPILFVFASDIKPRFHMHNVVAPLDIAFIEKSGSIESIQLMQPYLLVSTERPTYAPSRPIRFVFEARKDYFKDNNIGLDARVSWSKAPSDS